MWRDLTEIPQDLEPTCVTIGNFDGVHRGHQRVIDRLNEVKEHYGLRRSVAVIFEPHPLAVLRPEHAPMMLSATEHRLELLAGAGVDDVLVLPFTKDTASWSPKTFIQRVVVDGLHADAVVVGANFRFGQMAAGDVGTLQQVGTEGGFVAEGVRLEGGPQVWSSTYIRQCVATGDVEGAAEAMGRPFVVRGPVVRGDQRGRELGFPTANVGFSPGMATPAAGVYAGFLRTLPDGASLAAAISVGSNPTFEGEREARVEAYVLDRDLELYDLDVEVSFASRIRGMERFESIDELIAAMTNDVRVTRERLTT